MLELRPNCECCGIDLVADSADAWICSFECTFCSRCRSSILKGNCPNCGGDLQRRPGRSGHLLAKFPASTYRIAKESGCAIGDS